MVWRALLARLGISLVTLWVVSVLIFIGTNLLPGDIAQIILGQMATPENTAVLRAKLGLDKHPIEQYLVWLSNVAMGDLGISKAGLGAGLGTPIVEMLGPRIDNTAMLTVLVGAIAIPISVALGLLAAMHPGTRLDRTITFSTLNIISIPDFLIATILVLVFAVSLGWLPSIVYLRGDESGWVLMKTIAMPLLTLVILVSAQIIRMTRATVLNVMSSPYVEMAILKGIPRRRIILRHALFNAIGPIVNVIALNLAWLVGGVVVVEQIFSYPGLAKLMIEAVQMRDMPLVQACAMIFCAVYVVLIFIADMATILSNPRLRHPK
ncbi:MAG: ABC transporter permease [Proteobacteria bacterium]|jgi:peptide/nickel transport system permease protein|nr:ABC transporter permease [Pseudomonadota bacterium]MBT6065617.1 ABC transporter permease [Pseudomonadota bacterium]MBT6931117.1 ABC transporter permease [Pseudomonadota bacterium]MBT7110123.1 ABC transporter permease [Pseudomonadota bacterium]MBT7812506.1 ABC transporter permease [Pseudomonadota bacterium]